MVRLLAKQWSQDFYGHGIEINCKNYRGQRSLSERTLRVSLSEGKGRREYSLRVVRGPIINTDYSVNHLEHILTAPHTQK